MMQRASSQKDQVLGILLLLLTLLVYLPTMRAGFVWDDDRYVTANALVRADDGLSRIWFSAEPKDYYPVVYTSFWLEWRLWHSNPLGYHLTNVLLHALNAVLLWVILRRLCVPAAWLCAALFAVHPLNVESVAWISQRKNTLAMCFYLLSILSFLRWDRARHCFPYCLALVLFALSLLTKPIAVMFPVVIIVYRWWRREGAVRRYFAEAIPFLAASALLGAMAVIFQQAHSLQGEPVGATTAMGRVLVACRALLFYLHKTLWPVKLCTIYPEWQTDVLNAASVLPAVVVLLVLILLVKNRLDWGRASLFAAAYYFLMLFPVLGFFEVGFLFYAMVSDHWVYPALPAVLALVPAAVLRVTDRVAARARPVAVSVACVAVIVLAALSFRQCAIYRDMKTLFSDALAGNPRAWVAHVILGNTAFAERELDRAESHYRRALRIRPEYWEARNGLGIVYATRGRLDEAIELFVSVLARKPEHASARRNLRLARRQKREKEAIEK